MGNRAVRAAAILLLSLSTVAAYAGDQVGTRAFPFLRIGVGARAAGMGEAYTSIANGADGIEWNPAGMGQVNNPSLNTSYLNYLSDIHAGSVGFVQPAGRLFTVGLSLRFLNVGNIQTTTVSNPTGEGLSTFSSSDISLKAGLAVRLSDTIYLGAAGAILSGSIDDAGASGFSGDFGLLIRNPWRRLKFGAAIRNLGVMTSAYQIEKDALPTVLSLGASHPFFGRRLLLSSDWNWSVDYENEYNFGIECEPVYDFIVRLGYRTHFSDIRESESSSDLTGLSFGVGIRRIREYEIDYAFASMGDLGGTHRFSFTWVFH